MFPLCGCFPSLGVGGRTQVEGDGKISGCFPVWMFPQCGSRWEVGGLVEGDGKISGGGSQSRPRATRA